MRDFSEIYVIKCILKIAYFRKLHLQHVLAFLQHQNRHWSESNRLPNRCPNHCAKHLNWSIQSWGASNQANGGHLQNR